MELMIQGSAVTSGGATVTVEGVRECVGRLYAKGGLRYFYRGCFINALNSGPAAAITFVANDLLRDFLRLR